MNATIYTTPTCGYCKQAKIYLNNLGVSVKEIDISRDPRAAEEINRKTGQTSVPVIIIKGSTVVGFDKNRINLLLGVN
ncbi:MAG: glutaredoxin family protein [Spirochaetota bacterium]|nr:glutaredoxin family protein [Spirochaetota bacterium]